jgi:tetratricopeptide (TPR) repeat protein
LAALRLAPDNATAFYNRAGAYRALGNGARALDDYSEAIRLDPDMAIAHGARGDLYAAAGETAAALADYDRAIALDPSFLFAVGNRGNLRKRLGNLEGALEDMERAIAIAPATPELYVNRGSTLELIAAKLPDADRRDRLRKAAADHQQALGMTTPAWPHRAVTERSLERVRAALRGE